MHQAETDSIVAAGCNCWCIENAGRIAIAVDDETYFRAVREAILSAGRTVFILGWDIHSRLQLVRDGYDDGYPWAFGALLDFVAKRQGVDVYVLSWDFTMIYLLERRPFPPYPLNWKSHSRVRFRMDDEYPMGVSQHQKIGVVDDAVAFSGGLDLSKWSRNTRLHRLDDERCIDPDGEPYPAFHDVRMLVDGDAAAALGYLWRERWMWNSN